MASALSSKRELLLTLLAIAFGMCYLVYVAIRPWLTMKSVKSQREYVDLSELGEVGTESVWIQTAHIKSIRHRGSWIIVVDETENNMLFLKRSAKHITCPNTWGFMGEHTKTGESYAHAAVRGLKEELKITPSQIISLQELPGVEMIHLEYSVPFVRIDNQWTMTFVVKIYADSIHPDDIHSEADGFRWVPVNESASWLSHCDSYGSGEPVNCRSCTDASNVYLLVNRTKKVSYKSLTDVAVTKINLYLNSRRTGERSMIPIEDMFFS
jgi:isopentenyldiphosphate isomerase